MTAVWPLPLQKAAEYSLASLEIALRLAPKCIGTPKTLQDSARVASRRYPPHAALGQNFLHCVTVMHLLAAFPEFAIQSCLEPPRLDTCSTPKTSKLAPSIYAAAS